MNLASIPQSIGIIMDGNRRWAKERNLSTLDGHRAGYEKLKEVVRWASKAGVKYVTVFAFSTENWLRDKKEVSYLMDLFSWVLENEIAEIHKENIKMRYIGDLSRLSPKLQKLVASAEKKTGKNTGVTLVSAVSYGGRKEIVDAVNVLRAKKTKGDITEADFSKALYTHDIPDPDLIIRTSGEMRTSGFLPWQAVYSELFFVKTFWPAFSKAEFTDILKQFGARQRRLGR
ncbi:MAG: polyprenyl diphosphate synthase [Patescibacteria group bacterium]|mgnify:CR=1 FL=1